MSEEKNTKRQTHGTRGAESRIPPKGRPEKSGKRRRRRNPRNSTNSDRSTKPVPNSVAKPVPTNGNHWSRAVTEPLQRSSRDDPRSGSRPLTKPPPPKPVRITYATVTKPISKPTVTTENPKGATYEFLRPHTQHTQHIPLTNYTPPRGNSFGRNSFGRNSSRDVWEYAYFRELLALRNIFINEMEKVYPGLDLRSPEFFDQFSNFAYTVSSKYISPYLEPLTERLEADYTRYLHSLH